MPVLDKNGAIADPDILAAYERICGPRKEGAWGIEGWTASPSRVDSAEAFLRLALRQEAQGRLDVFKTLLSSQGEVA